MTVRILIINVLKLTTRQQQVKQMTISMMQRSATAHFVTMV